MPPSVSKAAAVAIDWARISNKLGLPKETLAALSAFRKRAADARIQHALYSDAKKDIDFEHYRKILKNKSVVEEGEKLFNGFKETSYDLSAIQKSIDAFEGKAVEAAKQAVTSVETELGSLNSTLKNIEDARPFDNSALLDDVAKARPEITSAVEKMVSKGKWTVPGYVEKFGNLSAI